jgi:outer membrane biosynthesis protein TonB
MQQNTRLTVSLFISICLHLAIIFFWPTSAERVNKKLPLAAKKIEVIYKQIPPPPSADPKISTGVKGTKGTLVDIPPQKPLEKRVASKYLSDRNSRVAKEMKARVKGPKTERPVPDQPVRQASRPREVNHGKPETEKNSPLVVDAESTRAQNGSRMKSKGFEQLPRLEDLYPSREDIVKMYSSSDGNYLPDVADGPVTQLNTQIFQVGGDDGFFSRDTQFYSYFQRIRRSLELVWNPNSALRQAYLSGEKMTFNRVVTTLGVTLNADGSLKSIHEQQSSGIRLLDEEAKQAIRATVPYNNPPKGLIENLVVRRHLSEIFIPKTVEDGSGQQSERLVSDIMAQLHAGQPFEELAKKYSASPSARYGGDLGFLRLSEFPAAYRAVVSNMVRDEIKSVKCEEGSYILYMREIQDEGEIHFPFSFIVESHTASF